ncbi:unnamed protein product, partial [Closterium sp. Naga37s-1]
MGSVSLPPLPPSPPVHLSTHCRAVPPLPFLHLPLSVNHSTLPLPPLPLIALPSTTVTIPPPCPPSNSPLKQPFYRPPASRLAALRLLLQMGMHPAWLEAPLPTGAQGDGGEVGEGQGEGEEEEGEEGRARGDLLAYVVQRGQLPGGVGDPAMAEVLLKGLRPMRLAGGRHKGGKWIAGGWQVGGSWAEGQLMGVEAARAYSKVWGGGVAARCACVAAHYGDIQEAHFWLLLPHALRLLAQGSAGPHAFWPPDTAAPAADATTTTADAGSGGSGADGTAGPSGDEAERDAGGSGEGDREQHSAESERAAAQEEGEGKQQQQRQEQQWKRGLDLDAAAGAGGEGYGEEAVGEEVEVWGDEMGVRRMALERIHWHSQITGTDAASKRVHEFIMVGDLEAAVTLLLATPFDSPAFHRDALRAVALSTAVSPSMHHLAAKVVATNMVLAGEPLTAVHLLCSIGQYADACTQLQAIGRWVDASTLAACHLSGADRAKVLHRWAQHTLNNEHDLWR